MSGKMFDATTDALATAIRMRQIKHNVTASNIANHETPGYKAQKVEFEEALAKSLELGGTDAGALPVTAEIFDNPEAVVNNDGNTVDMEKEMSALAENSILYKSALQLINKKMAALRYAVSVGR